MNTDCTLPASPANEIPRDVAYQAHSGTSFVPERRAEQEQHGYRDQLAADYAALHGIASKHGTLDLLPEEWERYRTGYRAKYLAWLYARGRLVSTMIAGPARFPVRQQEKRGDTAHRRLQELLDFQERALSKIRRTLCPGSGPIMAGDSDAIERLQAKIADAEKLQAAMKAANKVYRSKLSDPEKVAAVLALGISEKSARTGLRIGFPHYALANNNANIRRMRARLTQIEAAKQEPERAIDGASVRLEDSPADNRVRLFFAGKPAADVRSQLKAHGFRWAPSLGCWQAYRNHNAMTFAATFVRDN